MVVGEGRAVGVGVGRRSSRSIRSSKSKASSSKVTTIVVLNNENVHERLRFRLWGSRDAN